MHRDFPFIHTLGFVALFTSAAGCSQQVHDDLTFIEPELQVVDSQGDLKPTAQYPGAIVDITARHIEATLPLDRSSELPVLLTISGDLFEGAYDGLKVPLRVCVCHKREGWGKEEGLFCDDDEERDCQDVDALMTGTYAEQDCEADQCLEQLHATFDFPQGGAVVGRLVVFQRQEWETVSENHF